MSDSIEVSVLLPFHRVDEYLYSAINSCLNSIDCRIEIVLIDTRDNNKVPKLQLNNQSEHVVRNINAPGASYYSALKQGLEFASSRYIALMNSDDLISKVRFKLQLDRLKESQSDLCVTDMRKFSRKIENKLPSILGEIRYNNFSPHFLLLGAYWANATWLFLKDWAIENDVFEEVGEFSDWKSALRTFPKTRIVWIREELYYYRLHKLQTTKKGNPDTAQLQKCLIQLNQNLGLPNLTGLEHLILAGVIRPRILRTEIINRKTSLMLWRKAIIEKLCTTDNERVEFTSIFERRLIIYSLFSLRGVQFRHPKLLLQILRDAAKLGRRLRW